MNGTATTIANRTNAISRMTVREAIDVTMHSRFLILRLLRTACRTYLVRSETLQTWRYVVTSPAQRAGQLLCAALSTVVFLNATACFAYSSVRVGEPYPTFCAPQFKGSDVCSERYQGTILIVSFLRIDNSPSHQTFKDLQEIHTKYAHDVHVIGILSGNIDDGDLERYILSNKITFPVVLDRGMALYGMFGASVYPSTGLFAKDKTLRFYLPGRRINFKKHLEGYVQFLMGAISQNELDDIINPERHVVTADYKKSENYYNFAKVYFKNDNLSKSKKLLDLSLSHNATYLPAYILYGHIYIKERQYDLGLEKFTQALQLDPHSQDAREGERLCLKRLGRQTTR